MASITRGIDGGRLLEEGEGSRVVAWSKEMRHGRTAHNMSSSSLRKKSDLSSFPKVPCTLLRSFLANLQEIFLGTKLFILFPAVPPRRRRALLPLRGWAVECDMWERDRADNSSVRAAPVEDRGGEVVAHGPVLLPTCSSCSALPFSAVDLLISTKNNSLIRSVLLYVAMQKQAEVNTGLLLLGALCQTLPLIFGYAVRNSSGEQGATTEPTLVLSRACSIVMLVAYVAYLFFQLKTHRRLFESQEEDENDDAVSEDALAMDLPVLWLG
ncbi:hypothetical protein J5N97_003024 [Dioscorea zingiberensis]|uniref:Uncharacterized protein n=1 Tax=Dioscorea zingiberensis TaxID=325984 RepID=A0A9D5D5W8_9LILI|nr:hypothetical protein J5N97_003024 [Dioscorea zingiberensis]